MQKRNDNAYLSIFGTIGMSSFYPLFPFWVPCIIAYEEQNITHRKYITNNNRVDPFRMDISSC